MNKFFLGLSYNVTCCRYLLAHRTLWKYILVPLVLNFLALLMLVSLHVSYFDGAFGFVTRPLLGLDVQDPSGFLWHLADAGLWVVRNAFRVILFILTLVLNFVVFFVLSSIVNAPFYELLSEKVLTLKGAMIGRPFNARSFIRDVVHSLKIEAGKILLYICASLLFLALGWIPVVGLLATLLGFLFTAWFVALGLCMYPMVLHRDSFSQILSWAWKNRLILIGFGLPSLIPFAGLLFVHFQVVGGTLIYVDHREGVTSGGAT